jgi:methionyl-tRNA formyltransferase
VHSAQPITDQTSDAASGTLIRLSKKVMALVCNGGSLLRLNEVQPAGKKPMAAAAFMNGVRLAEGETLVAMAKPESA